MAIPKYDEMMLPLLRFLADGTEHPQRELAEQIADHFKLTPQERAERLPKVKATYLRQSTCWAGFSLRRAGLAEVHEPGRSKSRMRAEHCLQVSQPASRLRSKAISSLRRLCGEDEERSRNS